MSVGTSMQVLIVDDDPALLHALPETVRTRMRDVLVETTDTAQEALKRIAEKDYDAIITDLKMPGMDGLALLNEIIAMLTVMTKSDAALPKNASGRLPPRSEPAPER